MKLTDIITYITGTAGNAENRLQLWLEARERTREAEESLQGVRRDIEKILMDPQTPLAEATEAAGAAKAREGVLVDRIGKLRAEAERHEREIFGPANTAWSRFASLKSDCEEYARELAGRGLVAAGLDKETEPGAWDRALYASEFVKAENRLLITLISPGVNLREFLEQTLPAMVELEPGLKARRDWYKAVLAGKKKYGNGPPALTGRGVIPPATKSIIPPPEPGDDRTVSGDLHELQFMTEAQLKRKRDRQRRADPNAPGPWVPSTSFEDPPVKAL